MPGRWLATAESRIHRGVHGGKGRQVIAAEAKVIPIYRGVPPRGEGNQGRRGVGYGCEGESERDHEGGDGVGWCGGGRRGKVENRLYSLGEVG